MSAEFAYKGSKRPLGSPFTPRSTRGFEGPEGSVSGAVSRHEGELSVMERDLRNWRESLPARVVSPEVSATPPNRREMLIQRLKQANGYDLPQGQRVRQLEDHPGDIS